MQHPQNLIYQHDRHFALRWCQGGVLLVHSSHRIGFYFIETQLLVHAPPPYRAEDAGRQLPVLGCVAAILSRVHARIGDLSFSGDNQVEKAAPKTDSRLCFVTLHRFDHFLHHRRTTFLRHSGPDLHLPKTPLRTKEIQRSLCPATDGDDS